MDNENKKTTFKSTFTRPFRMNPSISKGGQSNIQITRQNMGGCRTGRCGMPKQEIKPEEKNEENK